jgi:hypothetical protein
MIRTGGGLIALGLLAAGCAAQAVRTPDQARTIALSSVCAQRIASAAPHETMPSEWLAERRGDRWYAWLPFGPDAQLAGITEYGHMGAWINAKDGKVLACEAGRSRALEHDAPPIRIPAPPAP